jgi:hypothetical protein
MPRPVERDLAEVLSAVRAQLEVSAQAFRAVKYSRVLDSATVLIGAGGSVQRDCSVPFSAVSVLSLSSQSVTITSQPTGNRPTQGRGVAELGAYGFGTFNIAGRALTIYGNPGDTVVLSLFAETLPPVAVPGAVTLTGTPSVSVPGTVTVQPTTNTDLYSEALTSRLTSGNTATLTWPGNVEWAFVGVNVATFTGGTNLQIFLQQQDANGIWQYIAASSTLTAAGVAMFSAGPGTNGGIMLRSGGPCRLAWAVTGTFSALSFQLGLSCR